MRGEGWGWRDKLAVVVAGLCCGLWRGGRFCGLFCGFCCLLGGRYRSTAEVVEKKPLRVCPLEGRRSQRSAESRLYV